MAIATTARTAAAAFREEYRQHVSRIERDKRLSESTRHQYLAASLRVGQRRLAELREQHRVEVDGRLQDLQHRVFARPVDADEEAHRAALASVSELTAEQLSRRLLRAERVGDQVTAHAIFVVGVEKNAKAVIASYTATRPDAREHLEAMQTFESGLNDRNESLVSPLRPPQTPFSLRRMNDYQIDALAAAVEPAPAQPYVQIGIAG
jgi:hypothetical protein